MVIFLASREGFTFLGFVAVRRAFYGLLEGPGHTQKTLHGFNGVQGYRNEVH